MEQVFQKGDILSHRTHNGRYRFINYDTDERYLFANYFEETYDTTKNNWINTEVGITAMFMSRNMSVESYAEGINYIKLEE